MENGYLVKVFENGVEKETIHFYSDDLFVYLQENLNRDKHPQVKFCVFEVGKCLLDLS